MRWSLLPFLCWRHTTLSQYRILHWTFPTDTCQLVDSLLVWALLTVLAWAVMLQRISDQTHSLCDCCAPAATKHIEFYHFKPTFHSHHAVCLAALLINHPNTTANTLIRPVDVCACSLKLAPRGLCGSLLSLWCAFHKKWHRTCFWIQHLLFLTRVAWNDWARH